MLIIGLGPGYKDQSFTSPLAISTLLLHQISILCTSSSGNHKANKCQVIRTVEDCVLPTLIWPGSAHVTDCQLAKFHLVQGWSMD